MVGCCEATNANNDMMVMHVVHEHGESTRSLMNDICLRLQRVGSRPKSEKEYLWDKILCLSLEEFKFMRSSMRYGLCIIQNFPFLFFSSFFCLLSLLNSERERSESRSNSVIVCEE